MESDAQKGKYLFATVKNKYNDLRNKWIKSKTVHEIYAARWIWYHTLMAVELLIIIILLIGILIKI